ncbi:MinD/ParA family protein [Saliphagus sp. GCM10025334]
MIVAVAGGKGGVGKSTMALNLGAELGAVVVDADLAAADLPTGSGRGPDLHDVLVGRATPLDAVDSTGPVRILPCGRTLEGARASDLAELPRVVDALDRRFGRVVVDCPAGLARDVGVQLASADAAMLVTTPSKVAIHDAYRTHQLALALETPIAAVVVNRSRSRRDERLLDSVERHFGAPVVRIETRPAITEAQSLGRPLRAVAPECPALDALEALSRMIERRGRRYSEHVDAL